MFPPLWRPGKCISHRWTVAFSSTTPIGADASRFFTSAPVGPWYTSPSLWESAVASASPVSVGWAALADGLNGRLV